MLQRRMAKEREAIEKAAAAPEQRRFARADDAREALATFRREWETEFWSVSGEVGSETVREKQRRLGRPRKDEPVVRCRHTSIPSGRSGEGRRRRPRPSGTGRRPLRAGQTWTLSMGVAGVAAPVAAFFDDAEELLDREIALLLVAATARQHHLVASPPFRCRHHMIERSEIRIVPTAATHDWGTTIVAPAVLLFPQLLAFEGAAVSLRTRQVQSPQSLAGVSGATYTSTTSQEVGVRASRKACVLSEATEHRCLHPRLAMRESGPPPRCGRWHAARVLLATGAGTNEPARSKRARLPGRSEASCRLGRKRSRPRGRA